MAAAYESEIESLIANAMSWEVSSIAETLSKFMFGYLFMNGPNP